MKKYVMVLAVAAFVVMSVVTGFAQNGKKVYTNKDLEKYVGQKTQEVQIRYSGRKVTLDFDDASVTGILALLADIARQDGYMLTVDKRIQGKATLKMTEVSWDQVLDFLAENYNLVKTVKGKSIVIAPQR